MSKLLVDEIKQLVASRQLVCVVGTGVAAASTAGDPMSSALASWPGLLKSGARRCLDLGLTLPPGWKKRIDESIDSGDVHELVSAAENITTRLGAPGGGEFRRWLRETVGSLRLTDRTLLEALRDLGVVLATTNYDGLLEEVTGLPSVTWQDTASVERVLRGDDRAIIHLHGFHARPESVVLGIRSYEHVRESEHAQAVLRALRLMRSLLFVGFGTGLQDPNFGPFLQWSREVLAESEYRHFRLVRAGEVKAVQAQHPGSERLFVL